MPKKAAADAGGDKPPKELLERMTNAGQQHTLAGWASLDAAGRAALAADLARVDLSQLAKICARSLGGAGAAAAAAGAAAPEPVDDLVLSLAGTAGQRAGWEAAGWALLAAGKVGVVLLAGGQGTRLGSSAPKGCYDIGLPSRASLFRLQAERVLKAQALAAARAPAGVPPPVIPWYIMTSPFTDAPTKAHFAEHGHFGLDPKQLFFFTQGDLPCVTAAGKIIMETAGAVARAPDGNGGLYAALADSGALADMKARGVEALDVFCVDNALARVPDATFLGACAEAKAQCGARVLAKASPGEKVGVFVRRGGRVEVMEYSEMAPGVAESVRPADGRLRFDASNICMHFFSREFLEHAARALAEAGQYHVAHKKIPSVAGPVEGVKLELFIFDTFPLAQRIALLEVARADHFAPVKNAPGSASDTPEAARAALLAMHGRWVAAAGGKLAPGAAVEVPPALSLAGEGLATACRGRTFEGQSVLVAGPGSAAAPAGGAGPVKLLLAAAAAAAIALALRARG